MLLPSSIFLLSDSTIQPENTYSCILNETGQFTQSQKRMSINTNHSYHQHWFSEASLNWSNNKIRFIFNQTNRKRWGVRLIDIITHLLHKVFFMTLSLEGWPAKAKEAPFPLEVRLTPLDTNPVLLFYCNSWSVKQRHHNFSNLWPIWSNPETRFQMHSL